MMDSFFRTVVRFPRAVVLLNLLVTFFFVTKLPLVRNETNLEAMLPKTVDAWFNKQELEDVFGVKDMVVVGVFKEGKQGIFNPGSLSLVARITDFLRDLDGVHALTKDDLVSLSTLDNIKGTEMGMEVRPFMEEAPKTQEEADSIRKAVFENDMFIGSIVSADGTGTLILAELEDGANQSEIYFKVKRYIDTLRASGVPERIVLAGRPVIEGIFGVYMPRDMQANIPLVLGFIIVFLFFSFRSLRGVLLPVFIVVCAVVWTMATMGMAGIPVYTISTMMPVILIAAGIADGVHLLNKYYDEVLLMPHAGKEEIVLATMKELWVPVVMTSFTSMAGFLCNALSQMIPIRYFGLFTALGILYAMVVTITFLPAMLMILKIHAPARTRDRIRAGMRLAEATVSGRLLHRFAKLTLERKKAVAVTSVALVGICLYGISIIHVNASLMDEFRSSEPVYQADKLLNEKFAGTNNLNIMIKAREKDAFKAPVLLRKMDAFQRTLEKSPIVGDTLAISEFMRRMNKVMNEDREEMNIIPETRELAAQYLLLYSMSGDPSDFDDVVDYDYQYADIRASVNTDNTAPIRKVIQAARRFAGENFPEATVKLAGTCYTIDTFVDLIINGQIRSLVVGIIAIFLMTALMLKSFVGGLLSIIPILLCTLFNYGVMGLVGLPLEIGTALTGGMAIGIGVDYAIHYLNKYQLIARRGESLEEVSIHTMETAGKGIFLNAVVVIGGFLVLLNAHLMPQVKLGALVSSTMLICFLATVMILPLLLNSFRPSFMFITANQAQKTQRPACRASLGAGRKT